MTHFENKAKELGLDLNDLSKALKKEVNEYYEGVNELNGLKSQLENLDGEEAQALQSEIDELQDVLIDFDTLLVSKIEKYNQNKASYDEKLKKMAEGRERAKLAKAQAQGAPTPKVEDEPTPTPTPSPAPTPKVDEPTPTPKVEDEPKEEEKSDWTWLILAGLVGAVTLGAVILRKK